MATETDKVCVGATPTIKVEAADDKNRSPRHPRWTRQETLTLIEGKKMAENRGRKGRRSSSVFGPDQLEPKWDSVSSYCKQHGVNRGPVQCRKRWSNMVGDFKKIKAWQSQVKAEAESFWVMRNDLRKEKRLPGIFDKEVYDVLDGKAYTKPTHQLALVAVTAEARDCNGVEEVVGEDVEEEVENEDEDLAETVFDSSQSAKIGNGLFPDSERMAEQETGKNLDKDNNIPAPMPISEKRCQSFDQVFHCPGNLKEQQTPLQKRCSSQEACKRRRMSADGCHQGANVEEDLVKVLESNAKMLNTQLEAYNTNCQLDRDQRRDLNIGLVMALNKVTDALTRIADKM